MTNSKYVLAIGLAAATLVVVLPFFAGGVLLLQPSFAPFVVQAGLTPGSGPAWFGPVFGISAIVLSIAAFVVSWKQRSYVVGGLLAASGIIFMIPALIATGYLAVIVVPSPILGVIIGLGIFGLGLTTSIRTARVLTVTVSKPFFQEAS
jgi:hypothetical protein